MEKIFPICLIAAGAGIMAFNIKKTFSLIREMREAYLSAGWGMKALFLCYIGLLAAFLAGYVAVGATLLFSSAEFDVTLVALIFFFGSLFVLLGLAIQFILTRAVKKSSLEIIQALVGAVEARDPNLNGHSQHVAKLAVLLCQKLPKETLKGLRVSELEYAALLHDIGKLGVPESILDKSSSLTPEEWDMIREHPRIGKNILAPLQNFREISDWVLYHHERMDGQGYYHLPGDQIPLPSRIIAVADTYSAITMTRSYHSSRDYAQAEKILRESAGTQLDPEITSVFLSIPPEDVEQCRPEIGELLLRAPVQAGTK